MITRADRVPLPEGLLTCFQIAGIKFMRRSLLHASLSSASWEEIYVLLSLNSEANQVRISTMLLWQEEGRRRRNTLFWLVDEGGEDVAMHICKILLDGGDKETLSELVNAYCYIYGEPTSFRELAESKGAENILNMLDEVGVFSSMGR